MSKPHSTGNGRGIPAASYVRMSSDKQDASPQQQRDEVAKLAARTGHHLVSEYADEAVSGDRTDKRHGFQRMIDDAKRGRFKTILAWDQDRFSRADSIENAYYIHQLRQAGVKLVTVGQGAIDWDSFAGRLVYSVAQEAKHAYLIDLSRNVLRGQWSAAKRGEWFGRRPFGYRVENRRLIPGDPREVEAVRRMFREYLAGHSLRAVAVSLNAAGIRTKSGNIWKSGTVKDVLNNPVYVGTFTWNDRPRSKYHCLRDGEILPASSRTGERDTIVIENNHEAIIDRRTFDAVQQRMPQRRRTTTPHADGGGFVLTGVTTCGKCGGPMYGYFTGQTLRYRCHKHGLYGNCDTNGVGQAELLDAVLTHIELHFQDPSVVKRLRAAMADRTKQRTKTVDVEALRRQLTKVDSQLGKARVNMALSDGDDLRRDYEAVVRGLRSERDQLAASIQDAQKPAGRDADDLDQRVTTLVDMLSTLRATALAAPVPKQRELLAKLVDRVEVWSRRSGGPQTMWHLERGKVHLRPDVWLDDADKLSGLSRYTGYTSTPPRRPAVPDCGTVRPRNARTCPSPHCTSGRSVLSSGPCTRRVNRAGHGAAQ